MHVSPVARSLDAQREEFARNRFLAMPLAGLLAWSVVLAAGQLLSPSAATWVLYIATGSIAWLGMGLSHFTGEHFLDKSRPKNEFDALFFHGMVQAMLAFGIAIPFSIRDASAVPMSFGIVAGLMWLPLSWILRHPIGWVHAVARTGLLVVGWFVFPQHQLLVAPLIVIAMYLVTIPVLELRWRRLRAAQARDASKAQPAARAASIA